LIDYTQILLSPTLTGQTDTAESELKLRAGYWVYTSEFGGNLVDELTVREFLDNPQHEKLATDFFNYLKENFSNSEFNELYYNNIKLSNVLNDYYNKTVRLNEKPTKTVGTLQLTATTAVTYTENYFIGSPFSNLNFVQNNVDSNSESQIITNGISVEGLSVGLSNVGGVNIGRSNILSSVSKVYSEVDVSDSNQAGLVGTRSKRQVTVLSSINTGDSYYVSFSIYKTNNVLEKTNSLYGKTETEGSVTKRVTEWFRYALRKNSTQINPNGNVIKDYSFSNFSPSNPLLPNQSQLRIQFKSDRAILDTNNRTTTIPIEIVYDRPSVLINQFYIVEFGYSNASAGIDFGFLEGENRNLLSQSVNILSGSTGATVILSINNDSLFNMTNCEITVVLKEQGSVDPKLLPQQQYSASRDTFRVLSNQDNEITVLDNTSVDTIKTIENKVVPKILLQSFVDPNYNDNESEIWQNPPTQNTLITDGNSGFGLNVTLPLLDLSSYQLYTVMIRLGYELKTRSGNGGVVVVMNGNTDALRSKLKNVFPGLENLYKRTAYGILGYYLITVDLSNTYESNQVLNNLKTYWDPYDIVN
jgi:hypothetical protein